MSQARLETPGQPVGGPDERHSPYVFDQIRTALNGLRFGTVTVIVQDGVVVQVDRTERLRLSRRERSGTDTR